MYRKFLNEDGSEFGSFEVFNSMDYSGSGLKKGWYWWIRYPGCLPESEPVGPFETAEEAIAHARDES